MPQSYQNMNQNMKQSNTRNTSHLQRTARYLKGKGCGEPLQVNITSYNLA